MMAGVASAMVMVIIALACVLRQKKKEVKLARQQSDEENVVKIAEQVKEVGESETKRELLRDGGGGEEKFKDDA